MRRRHCRSLGFDIGRYARYALAMTIPDYATLMLPLLKITADGREHRLSEVTPQLALQSSLSSEELEERLPSGRHTTFGNRVNWAKTYLGWAGLLDSPKHGVFRITNRGQTVLAQHREGIDAKFLRQWEEFRSHERKISPPPPAPPPNGGAGLAEVDPQEQLESSYQTLRRLVAEDLLDRVKKVPAGVS